MILKDLNQVFVGLIPLFAVCNSILGLCWKNRKYLCLERISGLGAGIENQSRETSFLLVRMPVDVFTTRGVYFCELLRECVLSFIYARYIYSK